MFRVLACIADHDIGLVLAAGLICGLACVSAIGLFQRCRRAQDRGGWLAFSAAIAGAGVWSTHFVAMLAFEPGAPMSFSIAGTIASLILAMVGVAFGFYVALGGPISRAVGGAVVGLSFSGMHYAGILSVEVPARIEWSTGYVIASVALAMALSAASLVVLGRGAFARRSYAALLLMLAILSLHFTAMTAITILPDPTVVLHTGAVSRTGLGAAVAVVAVILVVTPFLMMRIEQMTQRRTLRTLRRSLDAIPGGMAFFDHRDRLVAWNAAYARIGGLLGVEPREGLARAVIIKAARDAQWIPSDSRVIDELDTWEGPAVGDFQTPDGQWLRHRQFSLEGGGGVVTLADVTAETETLKALTAAKDSAEAANAAKTAFLANISHEIRTPLNGVLGAAQLLGHRDLGAKERALVDMLQASGRLLNDLLTDLLDLSRLEAGAVSIRPEPTQVEALATEVYRLFGAAAQMKGLELDIEIDHAAIGWVLCDETRLLQILSNLVGNAIKFTEDGRVSLVIERTGDHLAFSVSDTGVGFEASQKDRLFERFAQADDRATRTHGGAGLGLAIVAELVALMGGSVDAVSIPGEGSTFVVTLRLPRIAPPAGVDDEGPGLGAGEGRVLIVDDNETNRRVLATILAAGGLDHVEARDGVEAVEAFSREPFSAVLMDLQMPVMDGLEATRRIRDLEAAGGRARTPIFMVSANCLEEHVNASLEAGADQHFAKPVSAPALLGALGPRLGPSYGFA